MTRAASELRAALAGSASPSASSCDVPTTPSGLPLARAPSQKELAYLLRVTTRHLRRWEAAEAAAGRQCSRPYTAADLWRLYSYRRGKGWDRTEAQRLRLTSLFEQFDEMMATVEPPENRRDHLSLTLLMLKSIAWENAPGVPGDSIPRTMNVNLALSAREQLRSILGCERARTLLARAFFEAALVSEANPVPTPANVQLPVSA